MLIVGLAGLRRAGKSSVADHLVAAHGFCRIHPFAGGKAAVRAYYTHIGVPEDLAWRMTEGDLKDEPSQWLPGGESSRLLMERLGRFMAVEMGPEWTIGRELMRARELGHERLLVESVVYEDQVLRAHGATIWMVRRPDRQPVQGVATDEYTVGIAADAELINDGTIEDLHAKASGALARLFEREELEPAF